MAKRSRASTVSKTVASNHDDNFTLVPGVTTIEGKITDALVVKDGNLFFLSEPDGGVPLSTRHGFGLYYHDCRFLDGYEVTVGGRKPEVLVHNAEKGFLATLGLSNPDLRINGSTLLKHSVEIRWERVASGQELALFDTIALRNLSSEVICFPLVATFQARFEDIFAIRGLFQGRRGTLHDPVWQQEVLIFKYAGADNVNRELAVHFSPPPAKTASGSACYDIELPPKGRHQITISLHVSESEKPNPDKGRPFRSQQVAPSEIQLKDAPVEEWKEKTSLVTDSLLLNRLLDRSLRDLGMLRSDLGPNKGYFAAGVPWFVALFGRDSIITALQTLAYDAHIAEQTIRLLAHYQGKEVNPVREEEPGKILHELRVGEMARLHEIPHNPYYGTIDATPLWLVLVGQHAAWTGEVTIFNELRSQIEAALLWIDKYGDLNGDGYVEYECRIEKGLANQGWKDSGDAIVNRDGSLATPPIALVEVQGYVFQAKMEMAALYRHVGESQRADALQKEAEELRTRFNRDFWVADGYYALALQAGKRPVEVLSSNTGHALWSGIADSDHAQIIADRLLSNAMFNGWGVRTLSDAAIRYNPLGYHLGTVWPHDNSIIAAGFKRYGRNDAALRILTGLMEAAVHFDAYRLPELFGGFALEEYGVPVSYPVACQPQAWSAGTIPFLLSTLLGLTPLGFENILRITRPVMPSNVNHMEVRRLAVGKARVDLVFERTPNGIMSRVEKVDGQLDVIVEE